MVPTPGRRRSRVRRSSGSPRDLCCLFHEAELVLAGSPVTDVEGVLVEGEGDRPSDGGIERAPADGADIFQLETEGGGFDDVDSDLCHRAHGPGAAPRTQPARPRAEIDHL